MSKQLQSPRSPSWDGQEIYDVVGVGVGPANLALAVALQEEAERAGGRQLKRVFLEAKGRHVWHPGMLLDDSLIQITVLKDLITVENPRSRFTFLNYLKVKDRLYEFLNLRELLPTRIEFNDYLTWVASELAEVVRYGREVGAILPVETGRGGEVRLLKVLCRDRTTGKLEEYLTRNVVVATGGRPVLPAGVEPMEGGRAFHSHVFMHRMERDFPSPDAPYRFVVVGSGQSAAEIFYYLLTHYRNADVSATIRRFAYKPVDDSDFTNQIFFPQMVDFYYDLPEEKRRAFFASLKDVNYAVVDHDLIHKIYSALYREKAAGRARARILPFLDLKSLEERQSGVAAKFEHLMHGGQVVLEADAVVLGTGYAWAKEHPLLDEIARFLERDDSGAYRIQRDYRVGAGGGLRAGVYLQGYCEATHGISETVLSLLPVRARDILTSLLAARAVGWRGAGAAAEAPSTGTAAVAAGRHR